MAVVRSTVLRNAVNATKSTKIDWQLWFHYSRKILCILYHQNLGRISNRPSLWILHIVLRISIQIQVILTIQFNTELLTKIDFIHDGGKKPANRKLPRCLPFFFHLSDDLSADREPRQCSRTTVGINFVSRTDDSSDDIDVPHTLSRFIVDYQFRKMPQPEKTKVRIRPPLISGANPKHQRQQVFEIRAKL